jgi:hypothetical protein
MLVHTAGNYRSRRHWLHVEVSTIVLSLVLMVTTIEGAAAASAAANGGLCRVQLGLFYIVRIATETRRIEIKAFVGVVMHSCPCQAMIDGIQPQELNAGLVRSLLCASSHHFQAVVSAHQRIEASAFDN